MYRNPLEQFIINDIFTISLPIVSKVAVSLTNIGLYLVISVVVIVILSQIIIKNSSSRGVSREKLLIKQSLYDTVHKIVRDQMGGISNEIYLPYLYTLFVLVLTSNLIGLIPYNFTSTSHLETQEKVEKLRELAKYWETEGSVGKGPQRPYARASKE